jgi:hypothetical protein
MTLVEPTQSLNRSLNHFALADQPPVIVILGIAQAAIPARPLLSAALAGRL